MTPVGNPRTTWSIFHHAHLLEVDKPMPRKRSQESDWSSTITTDKKNVFRRGKRERERSREWWETKHICWPEHEIATYILIYSCVFLCTTCTLIHISSCSDPTNGDLASVRICMCSHVCCTKASHVHTCSSFLTDCLSNVPHSQRSLCVSCLMYFVWDVSQV